jgi:aspartate 1-decarboxylase
MSFRRFLIGKIHRATVTDADVEYVGSITIDLDLMDAAGFRALQEVDVWDVTNGARFATYCIPGRRGGGDICINGAAAHLAHKGDKVIIAAFGLFPPDSDGPVAVPAVVPDGANRIERLFHYRVDPETGAFSVDPEPGT